jgi:hypothetical protein
MMANDGYRLDMTQTLNTLNELTQPEPQIDMEGFVQYRQQLELKNQFLSKELEILGMDYLPSYLVEWKKLKNMIQEVIGIRPFIKTFSKEEIVSLQGKKIYKKECLVIQFLLVLIRLFGYR